MSVYLIRYKSVYMLMDSFVMVYRVLDFPQKPWSICSLL